MFSLKIDYPDNSFDAPNRRKVARDLKARRRRNPLPLGKKNHTFRVPIIQCRRLTVPRLFYLSLLLVLISAAVRAEVAPVSYNRPLALRPMPPRGPVSAPARTDETDEWLNIRINSDNSGQVQNEQQVVVNPANPDNVVAVWRDFRLGYRRVGVGYSMDGGLSWVDQLFPLVQYPQASDPALTWNAAGTIYALILSYDPVGEDGLFVSPSTNGGLTWGPFLPAVNAVSGTFEDKELIACDRTGGQYHNNLYIAWARFTNNQTVSRINFVRSANGGSAWSTPVFVSDNTSVQWPVPAVGANGEVYVAWVNYSPASIRFDVSTNGGVSFGTDRTVQNTSFASTNINPALAIFCYPAMDVDITNGPNRGNIYIAYANRVTGSNDVDLFLTRSANNGTTWSTPVRINDDAFANGADQFHPWLVCDENGTLHLIFYDRRNNIPQNLLMDLYYTSSTDAGQTWSPNQRLTTVSSNPGLDSLDSGLIGEYNGLAVRNNVIHPVWTDTRNLNQDTYTAVFNAGPPPPIQHPRHHVPLQGALAANPNPFNTTLQVNLDLPEAGFLDLAVYDLTGRRVSTLAQGSFPAGELRRFWTPRVATGLYLLRAVTSGDEAVRKIMYVK
jgi:hypothetical protein